jgi:hypothetical protein
VVHLKHAHALILALSPSPSRPRPCPYSRLTPTDARISSRLVLHLVTLLPYYLTFPFLHMRAGRKHTCIHIHAYPYPSPSPRLSRLLLHLPACCCVCHPSRFPIQEPCSPTLTLPFKPHAAPRPSRRRAGLVVAPTLPPIALCIVCSHCRPSQTKRPSLCSRHPSRAPSTTSTQWPTRNTNPPTSRRRL